MGRSSRFGVAISAGRAGRMIRLPPVVLWRQATLREIARPSRLPPAVVRLTGRVRLPAVRGAPATLRIDAVEDRAEAGDLVDALLRASTDERALTGQALDLADLAAGTSVT